jgi:hypothetical protein
VETLAIISPYKIKTNTIKNMIINTKVAGKRGVMKVAIIIIIKGIAILMIRVNLHISQGMKKQINLIINNKVRGRTRCPMENTSEQVSD